MVKLYHWDKTEDKMDKANAGLRFALYYRKEIMK
jgi:hypothetical protein